MKAFVVVDLHTPTLRAAQRGVDVVPSNTSLPSSPCFIKKNGTARDHGLGTTAECGDRGPYEVDWAELENLFTSKYTHPLNERHAAAIIKVCHQYLAHYDGIPYTELPSLTPFVQRLVDGFQCGKLEYGSALRELCIAASKPFVARKVSEHVAYRDAVVVFVVTLCQAAAYEYGKPPPTSCGAGILEDAAAPVLHQVPSQKELASSAVVENNLQEDVHVSSGPDKMPQGSERAPFADGIRSVSSRSSVTSPDDILSEPADISRENMREQNRHEGPINGCRRPTEESFLGCVQCDSRNSVPMSQPDVGNIYLSGSQTYLFPTTAVNGGKLDGATFSSAEPVEDCGCENSGAPDTASAGWVQRVEETNSAGNSEAVGGHVSKAKHKEAQIGAVRNAVFGFLASLASQRRTPRHSSTKSDTKECKIASSTPTTTHLAYGPFDSPAFLPVLELVKTAFLRSGGTPVIHDSVMHLLLDFSRNNALAPHLAESRLLIELLREARFCPLAAAGVPSGAAYIEFREKLIETVLNLAECTAREKTSHLESITDDEALELVNTLGTLFDRLCAPQCSSQMHNLRNDLLCIMMLLSRHKRLLPFISSCSLLQKIIGISCEIQHLFRKSHTMPEVSNEGVTHAAQLCQTESKESRAQCRDSSCKSHATTQGDHVLTLDSPRLPAQGLLAELHDVESVALCWATITNCLEDPTCRKTVQESRFLRTLVDFLINGLNHYVDEEDSSYSRAESTRHHVLFMQAASMLAPALEHLADAFVDVDGLPLLLRMIREQRFPNLMDNFLHLLARICLVSNAAARARALLLSGNASSTVQILINCMGRDACARAPTPGEPPTVGLPVESGSVFLKSQHCATLLLAGLCYNSPTAREQFRLHCGPSAVVKQLETTTASLHGVCSSTPAAYLFCLSECTWASIKGDAASTKDYIRAGGVRVILGALKISPKLLQRHLLGCLTELLRDEEAVQICQDWRASDTGQSAIELLINLWDKDQQTYGRPPRDGCITDTWRPLNSQEMKHSSTTSAALPSAERFSARTQGTRWSAGCVPPCPKVQYDRIDSGIVKDASGVQKLSGQKEFFSEGGGTCQRASDSSLQQAVSLSAASSKQGEKACSVLGNVLERTVLSYECRDIRLDVFCAIESLTRGFRDTNFQLTTRQEQQMELMKAYLSCCQLEMWGDVKVNLQAKSVQPTEADLRWMETEIHELHSITLGVKDAQQALKQRACMEENKAVNEFYSQMVLKNCAAKK